jgi:hypothetical protein
MRLGTWREKLAFGLNDASTKLDRLAKRCVNADVKLERVVTTASEHQLRNQPKRVVEGRRKLS